MEVMSMFNQGTLLNSRGVPVRPDIPAVPTAAIPGTIRHQPSLPSLDEPRPELELLRRFP